MSFGVEEGIMQVTWKEGQRAYYIINGKVFNSHVNQINNDGLVWLRDGRVRPIDEIFKTKLLATEWLLGGKD